MVHLVFAFVHRAVVVFDAVLHTLLVGCKPWSIHLAHNYVSECE